MSSDPWEIRFSYHFEFQLSLNKLHPEKICSYQRTTLLLLLVPEFLSSLWILLKMCYFKWLIEYKIITTILDKYVSNVKSGEELGNLNGPQTDPSYCFLLRKVLPRLNSILAEMNADPEVIDSFNNFIGPLYNITLHSLIYTFRMKVEMAIGRCEVAGFLNEVSSWLFSP